MSTEEAAAERSVDRRRLLHRAGTVAAGIAGAGVAGAVMASPANAADGGTFTLGTANSAASTTSLTGTGKSATLELASTVDATSQLAPPALRLNPNGNGVTTDVMGGIAMDADGFMWAVDYQDNTGKYWPSYVYTSSTATFIWPVNPIRVIDTREPSLRANIINAGGSLDGQGRVLGQHTIHINLSNYVHYGYAAFGNMTAVSATEDGYFTAFPFGASRPTPSNLNYSKSLLAMSDSFMVGLGYSTTVAGQNSVLSLYVHTTTHVIIDVSAFVIAEWGQLNPNLLQAGIRGAAAGPNRDSLRRANPAPWAPRTGR